MPLIQIIVVLCIVGLLLWVVQQIPMDATIARIIRVVIVVAVCLWLLDLLFGWSGRGGYLLGPPVRGR